MVGTDDAHMMGDWAAPPNPTPMTLMSSFLNSEEFGPKPLPDFLAKNEPPPLGGRMPKMEVVAKVEKVEPGFDFSKQSNLFGDQKATSSHTGGGLGGRRAANGFNLPMINTELAGQPTMASPTPDLLTIPPGFSPTSLLESPVFLSNSLMLPSPTTGKLLFNNSGNASSFPIYVLKSGDEIFQDVPEAFAFKPPLDPNLSFLLHSERRVALSFDQQQHSFPSIKISQSENPMQTGSLEDGGANLQNQPESKLHGDHRDISDNVTVNQRMSDSSMGIEHSLPPDDQQDCEADQKEILSAAVGTPAEDGYNWRKYGQKQVKGSEYPRSYYKCTHLNCQVKKKVERSHEGHITEIIYKGGHNHPKPPPNRRSGVLSSQPLNDQQIDGTEQPGSQSSFDGKSTWVSTQNNGGQDWRNDGLEGTSPCIGTGELCDPSTTTVQQPQDGIRMSSDALDVSSTMSNEEDEDDRATHGSISVARDGDEDDTETKRRKLEACAIEMSAASRAVREPRVVVQTISEVDILDDGYRWRKYGQKVVKGNPNPRSYYKCTNPGCTVRKHVERASHDLKSVITTYEGKHNHDVPAARNSNHPNSASSNTSATSTPQTHSLMRRTEPTQDGLVRFESHASIGGYGLAGREQFGSPTSYSVAMGQMGHPGLTNLAMAGLGPMAPIKIPVLPPVHGYMGVHHQPPEGGFMVPKGEPKEETMPGSRLPMANGGSVYHQMMSRMPLGPQL